MTNKIHIKLLSCGVLLVASVIIGCSKKQAVVPAAGASANDSSKDSIAQTAPVNTDSLLTYEQRQGRHLFLKYCAVCHGEDGKGDGFNAFKLDPKPRDFTDARLMNSLSDDRIIQTITDGGGSVNKSPLMPAWGGRLQKDEIAYLTSYVRTFMPAR